MPDLALPNFEIRGFRGFDKLDLTHLGRVNLIVGKNNVGKSSLLEAIQIYINKGYLPLIWDSLTSREEFTDQRNISTQELEELVNALKYLFYGRPNLQRRNHTKLGLSLIHSPSQRLSISVDWISSDGSVDIKVPSGAVISQPPHLNIQYGDDPATQYDIALITLRDLFRKEEQTLPNVLIAASGMTSQLIGELWDKVTLTAFQDDVLEGLRLIAPGVQGLSLIASHNGGRDRIPVVKISDVAEPIPLRSLGDGMSHLLGIMLGLTNSRNGILLIDEFENGLHYLVQPQIWQAVFKTAQRLNVQVFATTHSWDCIRAFQQAAHEQKEAEGMLIRLSAKENRIEATYFDEDELAIATREQIEVR